MDLSERIEYYKSYQKYIDSADIDECIEVATRIDCDCNRTEIVREAIIQRLYRTRWIPIDENLPEMGEHVLVTVISPDGKHKFVSDAYLTFDYKYFCLNCQTCLPIERISAWMKFQEPYAHK